MTYTTEEKQNTKEMNIMANNTEILRYGKIRFWQNGIVVGHVSRTDAIEMVSSGICRVISSHAIEHVDIAPYDME